MQHRVSNSLDGLAPVIKIYSLLFNDLNQIKEIQSVIS